MYANFVFFFQKVEGTAWSCLTQWLQMYLLDLNLILIPMILFFMNFVLYLRMPKWHILSHSWNDQIANFVWFLNRSKVTRELFYYLSQSFGWIIQQIWNDFFLIFYRTATMIWSCLTYNLHLFQTTFFLIFR